MGLYPISKIGISERESDDKPTDFEAFPSIFKHAHIFHFYSSSGNETWHLNILHFQDFPNDKLQLAGQFPNHDTIISYTINAIPMKNQSISQPGEILLLIMPCIL